MKGYSKNIALLVLFALTSVGVWGRRITTEQAQEYAWNWWLQKDGPRRASLQPVATEFRNIHLFVDTAGRGFVMLAADDRSLPVLGYSLRNGFETDSMPDAVHDWIQGYDDQIQYLTDNNIEATPEIYAKWQDLNNQRSQLPQAWSTQVGPLVQSTWGQQVPFNNLCPSGTYTGCVATAMSQIMHYHRHPLSGVGSNSYSCPGYGTLSANFANVTFDWDNMLNAYKYDYSQTPEVPTWNANQANAVATLMKNVGIAVNMSYGTSASSANTVAANFNMPAAVNAYKRYFKYKWTARSVHIEDYTYEDWRLLLKTELDNNRPIQYSGSSEGSGHSWVCDGYDRDEFFHFNWGSPYGTDNGFFIVGIMNKNKSTSYNLCNKAVIGIEPDNSPGNSVTITASSNNTTWGTVTGGGTFTKYQDMVEITPSANDGYRFVGWSDASDANNNIISKDVPLKFLANGDNANLKANFESVRGDTLYYCSGGYTKYYGYYNDDFYGAIKIPSNCLISGNQLTHVMFFAPDDGIDLQILIYSTNTLTSQSQPVYSFNYTTTKTDAWETIPLPTAWTIDVSKSLFIAVKSTYYVAASMPAATANGSYYSSGLSYGWQQYTANGTYMTWMIKAITSSPTAPHKISVNKDAVVLTTVSDNVDLRANGVGISNKGANVMFAKVNDPNGCVTITEGYKLTARKVGTVRLKAYATDNQSNYAEEYVDLRIERGTLIYNKYYWYYWDEPESWEPIEAVPDAVNFDVRIESDCYLSGNKQFECHDLSFGTLGSIDIETGVVLNVAGRLVCDDPSQIVINSDATGSGTLTFGSGTPKATVEMYLDGTAVSDGKGGYKDPQWQLRGCVVEDFGIDYHTNNWYYNSTYWNSIHAHEWDETKNASGRWKTVMDATNIVFEPWKGYSVANYSQYSTTVNYTGTLINSDHTWTLTRTGSGNANVGANLLTNSYAAPIEISKLQFVGAQSSVIFYNTGSLLEWQNYQGDLNNSGTSPGQFLVCPVVTSPAAGMPTAIPSGQSFYVIANQDGATVSVRYSDVMKTTSGPMLAPSDEEFNVLGIRIKDENGGDRVVLVESERCGDEYDDGYDGMKYMGNASLPQLFVTNRFGNTSINASQSVVGQTIGVAYKQGMSLKMNFETEKLTGYEQLMLHDLKTGQYVDILSGTEYEFVTTEDDAKRFRIVRSMGEDEEEMTVSGNELFTGETEGRVMMCDMNGRVLWEADVAPNETVQLPDLPHGVYVIKSETATIKIVR